MVRKIILWSGITFMSVLILIGVVMNAVNTTVQPEDGVVEVVVEDGKTTTVEFEDLCLLPGEQTAYTVELNRKSEEGYSLTLEFVPGEESSLAEFAFVKIERYGAVVCEGLLATVFEQEPVVLTSDMTQEVQDLTVTYYLPLEVGNEAQKARAEFALKITASNE